jgi:HEAT repeat protein
MLQHSEHTHQQFGQSNNPEQVKIPSSPTGTGIQEQLGLRSSYYPPDSFTNLLLAALSSSEWKARVEAIRTIELLGLRISPWLIKALEDALRDTSKYVRAAAAQALGEVGGKAQKTALLLAVSDPEWNVRAAVIQALGALGQDAPVETLVNALADEDETVRETAVWALKGLGIERLAQPLAEHVEMILEIAGGTLEAVEERTPLDMLVSALNDEHAIVRAAAVKALGELGQQVPLELFVRVLEGALKDTDELVRATSAETLGELRKQIPPALLIKALEAALKDNAELVRTATTRALGKLGEQAPIEQLILMLKDSGETVRLEASIALGKLFEQVHKRITAVTLLNLLKDEHEDVRAIAAWALGERGEEVAVEPLILLTLDDSSEKVRSVAVWALDQLQFVSEEKYGVAHLMRVQTSGAKSTHLRPGGIRANMLQKSENPRNFVRAW